MVSSTTVVVTACLCIRLLMANYPHSGQGNPVMFGDYEAQRHWMEITVNLPIGEWYQNTSSNDLLYWGLDYPPGSAYISWLCGKVSALIEPNSMELLTSRGYETNSHKIFMRLSVVILDLIIFFPAVWAVASQLYPNQRTKQNWVLLLSLCQPALVLIDHGHFQYNNVCLGLALWAVYAISADKDVIGSILFCLSLNFKQIALYYAPAFFFALLGKCWRRRHGGHGRGGGPQGAAAAAAAAGGPGAAAAAAHVARLGAAVLGTFAVLWAPFCLAPGPPPATCAASVKQVLHRLFPFARGVFEDKVANLWYFLSVTLRVREKLTTRALTALSLGATLALLAVPCALAFRSPAGGGPRRRGGKEEGGNGAARRAASTRQLLLALGGSGLAFFLAAFQVHEKSILFPLTPLSLLILDYQVELVWFSLLSAFSMFPLLVKDGLQIGYVAMAGLLIALIRLSNGFGFARKHLFHGEGQQASTATAIITKLLNIAISVSTLGMVLLHVLEKSVPPPSRYPDLHPSLISLYSFLNIFVFYLAGCAICLYNEFISYKGNGKTKIQ